MSSPDNLNQFCSQLWNLQTLNGTASDWPNENTPKIRFDFLEEVTLKCKPTYLHHLTLPSLTKLDLSIVPEWTPSTPNRPPSYTLPALTNLCLTLTSDAGPYLPPQSSIPALDTLTIVNVGKCQTLPPEIYPSVRSIQLEGSGSTNYYACAFNAAPNAHSITIIASKYERNAISNALQLLADTRNPEGLYLAFASQFYLGSTSKPVFSKTRILPFVKQLLTNRQTIGNPPTVLDVVWSAQRTRPTGLESYVKTRR
ncbi:hypothetical protein FRC18_004126 [Serendipita sp. 400]|nr:hypothetical protein FRC18_004126 [Serendipita sp. 400]